MLELVDEPGSREVKRLDELLAADRSEEPRVLAGQPPSLPFLLPDLLLD